MYNQNINLNLYKTFLVVANSRSLAEASEKLDTEKGNISKNIKLLEDTLGFKLFHRENRGMILTSKGKELYEFVDKGLNCLIEGEKILQEVDDLSNSKIVIGSLSHLSSFYIMDCIAKIKKDYPKLKIELITGSTVNDLLMLLESHKIDFAIDSTIIDTNNKELKVKELKTIDNIFISNKPIEIKNIRELEKFEYILGAKYSNTTRKLLEEFKKQNIDVKQLLTIDTTELRVEAVKKGLGISYVMKDIVQEELKNKEIYEIKVPFELPKSTLHLIYLEGYLSKADKKFIKDYLK